MIRDKQTKTFPYIFVQEKQNKKYTGLNYSICSYTQIFFVEKLLFFERKKCGSIHYTVYCVCYHSHTMLIAQIKSEENKKNLTICGLNAFSLHMTNL